jgi:hypothetical protein
MNSLVACSINPHIVSFPRKKGVPRPTRLRLTQELPNEVVKQLADQEMAVKCKEARVIELLKEHQRSQGKTAEIREISR